MLLCSASMTTITELAKRLVGTEDEQLIASGDLAAICRHAVGERLRKTDMVFVYKRRFAMILPRMQPSALAPTVDRVRRLVAVGAGWDAVEEIHALLYPDPRFPETQDVLDWAEDHLRET